MKLLKKNLHETANPSAVREKADKKKMLFKYWNEMLLFYMEIATFSGIDGATRSRKNCLCRKLE